jgi:CheY-like chemotaxis protein
MRVLVAEDEHIIRLMISVVLREAGHEVVEAIDGASAWKLIEKLPAMEMIVTDYNMPGMNGSTIAHRARQAHPNIPVLFVTARIDLHSIRDMPQPFRLLAKPFTADQLMAALKGMLN